MNRNGLVIALLLSLGVNLGLVVSAGLSAAKTRQGRPEPPMLMARVEAVADELGLTAEKRQRFLERHRQFFAAAREPREKLRELRVELTQELFTDAPEEGRIDELVASIGAEMARFENETVRLVHDIRAQLPAAQHATYRRFAENLRLAAPPPGGPPRR